MRTVAVIVCVGLLGCSRPAQRAEPAGPGSPRAAADADRDPAALRRALELSVPLLEQANAMLLSGGGLGTDPARQEKMRKDCQFHAAKVMGILRKLAVLVNDHVITEADAAAWPEVAAAERALKDAVDLGADVPR